MGSLCTNCFGSGQDDPISLRVHPQLIARFKPEVLNNANRQRDLAFRRQTRKTPLPLDLYSLCHE